jgi:hypothetical protein
MVRAAFLLLIPIFFMVSCQKGDTGPIGTTGATGAAGAAGAAGPQGAVGSANVIYSDWFTPDTYVKDTVFGTWGFYYDSAVAAITQPILDSGTVITFGKLNGYVTSIWPTNQVEALPIVITYMDGASADIDTWQALLTPGNLRIQLQSSLNAYGGISNAHHFRYIIIPGGVKTNASVHPGSVTGNGKRLDQGDVNAVLQNYKNMSYADICQRLNVPQ